MDFSTLQEASNISNIKQKASKYDRQLRIWDDKGQLKLFESKILILGFSNTISEILKNLILSGFGKIIIVDDKKCCHFSSLENYFLKVDNSQRNDNDFVLSHIVPEIQKMNEDSNISCIYQSPLSFIKNVLMKGTHPSFDILIISDDMPFSLLPSLRGFIKKLKKPIIFVQNHGLVGYYQIEYDDHIILDVHNDFAAFSSLRIDDPFPELKEYYESFSDHKEEIFHWPYPVVLYHVLKEWKKIYQKERVSMEDQIPLRKWLTERLDQEDLMALNIIQAKSNIHRLWYDPRKLNSNVKKLFRKANVHQHLEIHDIILKAIQSYIEENNGYPPHPSFLPDMESQSSYYLSLKLIFDKKAHEDALSVYDKCLLLLQEYQCVSKTSFNVDLVKYYCKNLNNMGTVNFQKESSSKIAPKRTSSEISIKNQGQDNSDDIHLQILMLMKLMNVFVTKYGDEVLAANVENNYKGKESLVQIEFEKFLMENANIFEKICHWIFPSKNWISEIWRYGRKEFPMISSFLGGIVSQEVIKLVTQQYIPINNTLVYNGNGSPTTALFQFSVVLYYLPWNQMINQLLLPIQDVFSDGKSNFHIRRIIYSHIESFTFLEQYHINLLH